MEPTPFPDLNLLLNELVVGARRVLADNFLAASLQGSFAVGDFDVHSDADFVIATTEPLNPSEIRDLTHLHERLYAVDSPWAGNLEGSYFPEEILKSCSRRKEKLWYVDRGSKVLVLSDHCNTAVVRRILKEHGIALAGRPPQSLVEDVPDAVLRSEILETMHRCGNEILAQPDAWFNRFYQGFIVLNYARMWCDYCTASVGSKRRGTEWAEVRVKPPWRDLIDRAWETRPNPAVSVREPPEKREFDDSLDFLRHVLQETQQDGSVPAVRD